jgi:tripartite-type tricarboxylate transporter receptor subunit TctC
VVQRINAEVTAILNMPDVKKRIVDSMSCDVVGGTPAEFRKAVKDELDYYARAARDAKLAPQ